MEGILDLSTLKQVHHQASISFDHIEELGKVLPQNGGGARTFSFESIEASYHTHIHLEFRKFWGSCLDSRSTDSRHHRSGCSLSFTSLTSHKRDSVLVEGKGNLDSSPLGRPASLVGFSQEFLFLGCGFVRVRRKRLFGFLRSLIWFLLLSPSGWVLTGTPGPLNLPFLSSRGWQ